MYIHTYIITYVHICIQFFTSIHNQLKPRVITLHDVCVCMYVHICIVCIMCQSHHTHIYRHEKLELFFTLQKTLPHHHHLITSQSIYLLLCIWAMAMAMYVCCMYIWLWLWLCMYVVCIYGYGYGYGF